MYHQFYPGLFALCRTFFKDSQDVVTALNNGMLNVFKNMGQYDAAKGDLFNWTYTIVRNAAINHFNTLKAVQPSQEITAKIEEATSYSPFNELDWEEIYINLDKLPPATRIVCTLFYIDGFSIKEISEKLNLSEGTVKWHLNESRNKLKLLLTPNLKPISV